MVGLALLGAILSFGDEYAATWVGERFTFNLRGGCSRTCRRSSRTRSTAAATATCSRGSPATCGRSRRSSCPRSASCQAAARLLFFTGALFLLSWKLALAALVVVPLFFFAARSFARLSRRAAREARRRSGSLTAVAEEALGNAALVQSANTQGRELARFEREAEGKIAASLASTRISGLFAPVIDLIELLGAVLIIVFGTWALAGDELTLGGLLAFLAYLAQLYRPVRDLSHLGQTVFEASAGAERVIELLDTEPAVRDAPHALPLARAFGQLELDRVSYRYPGSERPALDGQPRRATRPLRRAGRRQRRRQVDAREARACASPIPTRGRCGSTATTCATLTLRSLRDQVALLLQDAPLFDGRCVRTSLTARHGASEAELSAALDGGGRPRGRAAGRARHAHRPARARAVGRPARGASRWRARCSRTRRCSCSTSPPPASTPRRRGACSARCSG